jgi:hypothetical protein
MPVLDGDDDEGPRGSRRQDPSKAADSPERCKNEEPLTQLGDAPHVGGRADIV